VKPGIFFYGLSNYRVTSDHPELIYWNLAEEKSSKLQFQLFQLLDGVAESAIALLGHLTKTDVL